MHLYQLEIVSACMETIWQCDTSLRTSSNSGYHALLLINMDCNCMTTDSGVPRYGTGVITLRKFTL